MIPESTTRLSPIGPVKVLHKLHQGHALGDYLLLLAHDVIDHEADYVFLLDEALPSYRRDGLIIMDNGVIELGKAVPFEDVIAAADIALADCIIMPDVVGDFRATQQAVEAEMDLLQDCTYPIMKVPQGSTDKELIQCIEWLMTAFPGTWAGDYWGIPRWITNKLGTREHVIDYILSICTNPQIHLLGMSDNFEDDVKCAIKYHVMGIDSANPIILGIMNQYMETTTYHHPKRGNYWEAADINHTVLRNLRYVREAIISNV